MKDAQPYAPLKILPIIACLVKDAEMFMFADGRVVVLGPCTDEKGFFGFFGSPPQPPTSDNHAPALHMCAQLES